MPEGGQREERDMFDIKHFTVLPGHMRTAAPRTHGSAVLCDFTYFCIFSRPVKPVPAVIAGRKMLPEVLSPTLRVVVSHKMNAASLELLLYTVKPGHVQTTSACVLVYHLRGFDGDDF